MVRAGWRSLFTLVVRGRQARARGNTDKACPQQSGEPPVFGSGRNHPRPRNGARAACPTRCQLSSPRSLSHAAHVGRGPDADVVGSNQALRSMGRPQLEAGPGLRGGTTVTRGGHAAGNRSLRVLRLCHVLDARLPTCLHLRQTSPEIREICCPLLRCSTCACWGVAKPLAFNGAPFRCGGQIFTEDTGGFARRVDLYVCGTQPH